ncbi:hypothetical protein N7499_003405 [Penicillium canescens]|uniref:Uncharacterized protein n=1 Tax=Penicillium canescens TaxID=5083 RepID=A0AAD6I8R0_PENCN|nr:uncharacterized protein N7446_012329 [Penicillium canescens]KAJ6020110.1 hypothetical protein N7522_000185 [Penicillium canescens]KAJ6038055.1 hypothetical protein N7460_007826 [Penicillium canescens]KAJ6045465.1 hypothetical protein N7446_012329 [Penicillium canescens]KAJ6061146.1 hypothetical protein N7444_001842 [Penicillium canescens]KAJ6090691.1 hypothetical protein N7499_003405 [Penicillium canescens]
MAIVSSRRNSSPEVSLIFRDYSIPMNQMKGPYALSRTPNDLRLPWLMRALCYTREEASKNVDRFHISNIEQLGSLSGIIAGGRINQPLKMIGSCSFENDTPHGEGKALLKQKEMYTVE